MSKNIFSVLQLNSATCGGDKRGAPSGAPQPHTGGRIARARLLSEEVASDLSRETCIPQAISLVRHAIQTRILASVYVRSFVRPNRFDLE